MVASLLAGVLNRFQRRGVELLVQVGAAVFSETVEATMNLRKKTVQSQFPSAAAGVVRNRTAKCFDCARGQVPVLPDQFENPVICRDHPFRWLTHPVRIWGNRAHISTGTQEYVTFPYQYAAITVLKTSGTDYSLSNTEQNL